MAENEVSQVDRVFYVVAEVLENGVDAEDIRDAVEAAILQHAVVQGSE